MVVGSEPEACFSTSDEDDASGGGAGGGGYEVGWSVVLKAGFASAVSCTVHKVRLVSVFPTTVSTTSDIEL